MLTVIAGATGPSGRWNTAVDILPVDKEGSVAKNALKVAPVLLTIEGIVPFSTPAHMLLKAVSKLMRYNVCL